MGSFPFSCTLVDDVHNSKTRPVMSKQNEQQQHVDWWWCDVNLATDIQFDAELPVTAIAAQYSAHHPQILSPSNQTLSVAEWLGCQSQDEETM